MLLPALALFLTMVLLNESSRQILPYLQTNAANVSWSIGATFIQLAILAFCFSTLLLLAAGIVKHRSSSFRHTLATALQCTPISFILLALSLLVLMLTNALALLGGKLMIPLSASVAPFVVITIWALCFLGGGIFLSFTNVFSVIERAGVFASVRASAQTVKRHYGSVVLISIMLFFSFSMLDRFLPNLIAELVKSFMLIPYLSLFLVFFLQKTR